jgi:hypothetical protein
MSVTHIDAEWQRRAATDCLPAEPMPFVRDAWPDGVPLAPTPESAPWPAPIGDAALRGIAGEFTRTLLPHSEADPSALLIHFLVAYGNCIGRDVGVSLDGRRRHALNLYAVFISEEGKARSDAAMEEVRRAFAAVDPVWAEGCIQSGLASGEGLIAAVRDPTDENDPGALDKRLLAFQPEFGHLLRKNARGGNSLLHVLGEFFGAERVQVMTRKNALRATGAHVSLIAHGTKPQVGALLQKMGRRSSTTSCLLWACVRRSKLLPRGSALSRATECALYEKLGESLARAVEAPREIGMDLAAGELWDRLYTAEHEEEVEECPEVVSLGEAMLLRLAGIYAAADGSAQIGREHLEAAQEVWRYAKESARHLFRQPTVDGPTKLTDRLQRKICGLVTACLKGMTRRELIDQTGRNYSAEALQDALEALKRKGYLTDREEGEGSRTVVRWFAAR